MATIPQAKRLVVMISGAGSNLQAILDATASGKLNAQVVLVVSIAGLHLGWSAQEMPVCQRSISH